MGLLFDSYMLEILVLFITTVYLLYSFFTSSFNHWKDRGIPFIKPTIFFGNIKDNFLNKKSLFEVQQDIYTALYPYKIGGYFELKNPSLMVRDPELIEKILIKDFSHFYDRGLPYDTEFEPLSGHLFNVEGKYWRSLRYKLTPTFTTGKLKSMFGQVSKHAANLATHIDEQLNTTNCFNSKDLISMFSVDVIASCAFGVEFNHDSEKMSEFKKMVNKVLSASKLQLLRFILRMYYPKLARFFKIKIIPDDVNDYFMQIVKETVKYRKEKETERNDFFQLLLTLKEQEDNGKNMNTLVPEDYYEEDAIMNQPGSVNDPDHNLTDKTKIFTEECIAAQCFVFLTAGSESTSSTISFCLYSVAANPHVQKRLQTEIDTVLAKYNGELSYQALKEMVYLEQVVNETLRQYPVASFIFRKCNKFYNILDTNYVIEAGTRVVIPVYAIHNDPNNYPDPEKFDPERFSDNKKIRKGTYLPFGDGPRICIAMRFALLEVKACMISLLSCFNVRVNKRTQEPVRFNPEAVVLQPIGIWLEFDKRVKTV